MRCDVRFAQPQRRFEMLRSFSFLDGLERPVRRSKRLDERYPATLRSGAGGGYGRIYEGKTAISDVMVKRRLSFFFIFFRFYFFRPPKTGPALACPTSMQEIIPFTLLSARARLSLPGVENL